MTKILVSRRARLVSTYALFVLGALCIYGMMNRFIPSESYAYLAQVGILSISALLSIVYYLSYFKKNSRLKRHVGKKNVASVLLGVPLFFLMLLFPSFYWGLPAIIHHVIAKDAHVRFKVHAPRYAYVHTTGRCTGRIVLDDNKTFSSRICRVPEHVYNNLSEGSYLLVRGQQSLLGFTYDAASSAGAVEATSSNQ